MDVVRATTFVGALLLAWISLRPFIDLGDTQIIDSTTGNEALTYAVFGCLAMLTIALSMRDDAGVGGGLLSRNIAGAASFDSFGDRRARAGARRQLAWPVRPQK